MRLEKRFEIDRSRDDVVALLCRDETLIGLFPDNETEIVDSQGDERTTRTRYTALGREGVATFRFTFLLDGNVRFEKVCDGRVWSELRGEVRVEEEGERSRIEIEMAGHTKPFVPEFAIKGPMEDQIEQMATGLRELLAAR